LQYERLYDANGKFRPEVGKRAVTERPATGAVPAEPQDADVHKSRDTGEAHEE
jgi:hypothetical protein